MQNQNMTKSNSPPHPPPIVFVLPKEAMPRVLQNIFKYRVSAARQIQAEKALFDSMEEWIEEMQAV